MPERRQLPPWEPGGSTPSVPERKVQEPARPIPHSTLYWAPCHFGTTCQIPGLILIFKSSHQACLPPTALTLLKPDLGPLFLRTLHSALLTTSPEPYKISFFPASDFNSFPSSQPLGSSAQDLCTGSSASRLSP